jgi:hypothetical protein
VDFNINRASFRTFVLLLRPLAAVSMRTIAAGATLRIWRGWLIIWRGLVPVLVSFVV